MRILKYFIVMAALISCVDIHSQLRDEDIVYYRYELVPTGEVDGTGDTVYNAFLTLSEADMHGIERLILLDSRKEQTLSLNEDSIVTDNRIEKSSEGLRLSFEGWTKTAGFTVTGIKEDKSQVEIRSIDEQYQRSIKTIDTVIKPIERSNLPRAEKPKAQL